MSTQERIGQGSDALARTRANQHRSSWIGSDGVHYEFQLLLTHSNLGERNTELFLALKVHADRFTLHRSHAGDGQDNPRSVADNWHRATLQFAALSRIKFCKPLQEIHHTRGHFTGNRLALETHGINHLLNLCALLGECNLNAGRARFQRR